VTVELSVVIPAYNAEETFGDQLAALTRQVDPGNFEVVVVDNRSTDRTREVAQNFADRLDLRVVDASQRAGEPYARNVGLEAARSDKVAFCDADDVVDAGWVGAMRRALADHRLVTGPLELEELNPPWIRATRRNPQEFRPQSKYGFLPHGAGANLGVDRVAALEIGGFDETLPSLPDTDFCWRMQLAGYELHFAPDAIVHYRLRHRTRDVIRQARQYAVADVALHRRYESQGMPPIRVSSALGGWAELALRAPLLLTRAGRFRYAWMLGFRLGRIQGMMRYRFPAL
jgi:glycosyltransferase involved in cell wall biosynthesis